MDDYHLAPRCLWNRGRLPEALWSYTRVILTCVRHSPKCCWLTLGSKQVQREIPLFLHFTSEETEAQRVGQEITHQKSSRSESQAWEPTVCAL